MTSRNFELAAVSSSNWANVNLRSEPQNKFFYDDLHFFIVCEENVGNVPHVEGCVADVRGGSNELVVGRKCRTHGNRKFDLKKFSVSG